MILLLLHFLVVFSNQGTWCRFSIMPMPPAVKALPVLYLGGIFLGRNCIQSIFAAASFASGFWVRFSFRRSMLFMIPSHQQFGWLRRAVPKLRSCRRPDEKACPDFSSFFGFATLPAPGCYSLHPRPGTDRHASAARSAAGRGCGCGCGRCGGGILRGLKNTTAHRGGLHGPVRLVRRSGACLVQMRKLPALKRSNNVRHETDCNFGCPPWLGHCSGGL